MKAYEDDKLQVGQHDKPLTDINYLDVPLLSQMDIPLSDWQKHLNYRHFQFIGAICEDIIFGCAIVKSIVSMTAFAYVYLPKSDDMTIVSANDLVMQDSHIDTRPKNNYSIFAKKDLLIHFRQRDNLWKAGCETKEFTAEVKFEAHEFQPMCLLTLTGGRGFTYAQKYAGLPAKGFVKYKDKTYDLEALGAFTHHDWTGGFLRSETVWQWACFTAKVQDVSIGLNVSRGVNETGYTENCYWINGKLNKVNFIHFTFDRQDINSNWTIKSEDGQIDLMFEPHGFNIQKKNFVITKSNFKQIIGTFTGQVGGVTVDKIYGFVEDQYLKW